MIFILEVGDGSKTGQNGDVFYGGGCSSMDYGNTNLWLH